MAGIIERMEAMGGPAEFHHVDVDQYTDAVIGLAREHIEKFGGRSNKALLKKPKSLREYVWQTMGSPVVAPLAHNEAHDKLETVESGLSQEEEKLAEMRSSDNLFTIKAVPDLEAYVGRLTANVHGLKAEVMSSNKALLDQFQGDHNLG